MLLRDRSSRCTIIFARVSILIALLLSSIACTSVFHHPDSVEYLDRSQVKYSNRWLVVDGAGEPRLTAWHLSSPRQPPRGTIVQFHGNAQNLTAHVFFMDWFLAQGFDVLTFDYRGYGTSEGDAELAGMARDAERLLTFSLSSAASLTRPLILNGQSLGGALLVRGLALSSDQDAFSMMILDSTFASYRSIARRTLGRFWLTWPLQYPLSWIITDDLSPKRYAGLIRVPTLLVHGRGDSVVPLEEGIDLFASLPLSLPKQLVLTDSLDHVESFMSDELPARAAFLDFFAQHVRVDTQKK